MTTQADFTEEEWTTLVRAPMVAGLAITIADPGGPIEVVKETSAVVKFAGNFTGELGNDLIGEIGRAFRALAEQHKNPVGDFKPKGAMAAKEILDELGRAAGIVAQKGTPEEAAAFRAFILECAQRAANAAKEGGFLGFHAERVSQGEKDMLAQIEAALAA
jgi:hypothetical protein